MKKLNEYRFVVEREDGKTRTVSTRSTHLNGAIRKIYQEYDFDHIVKILL
jgi:hypothetical protein